jgi:hypothetical protein
MTDSEKIDRALMAVRAQYAGRAESEYVSRQAHPERETRSPGEKERAPEWFNRVQPPSNDRSDWGGSGWRGGSMGGHGWGGGRDR